MGFLFGIALHTKRVHASWHRKVVSSQIWCFRTSQTLIFQDEQSLICFHLSYSPFLILTPCRLDYIGPAGLFYDIEAIKGRHTPVKLALDALESLIPVFCMKMAQLFRPYFLNLFRMIWNPRRSQIVKSAILGVHEIASHLLDKANQETEEKEDKSILSVLGMHSIISPDMVLTDLCNVLVWSKMSSPQLQLLTDKILAQVSASK